MEQIQLVVRSGLKLGTLDFNSGALTILSHTAAPPFLQTKAKATTSQALLTMLLFSGDYVSPPFVIRGTPCVTRGFHYTSVPDNSVASHQRSRKRFL